MVYKMGVCKSCKARQQAIVNMASSVKSYVAKYTAKTNQGKK
ncbi:MAG: hypothetical protein [Wigfec virus K19_56]|nr:MAG: hypothetical protein [Wigfec virus K19_56]